MSFWEHLKTNTNLGSEAIGTIALDTLIGLAENQAAHRYLDRLGIEGQRGERRLTLVERIRLVRE